jgi:hypothetical protein
MVYQFYVYALCYAHVCHSCLCSCLHARDFMLVVYAQMGIKLVFVALFCIMFGYIFVLLIFIMFIIIVCNINRFMLMFVSCLCLCSCLHALCFMLVILSFRVCSCFVSSFACCVWYRFCAPSDITVKGFVLMFVLMFYATPSFARVYYRVVPHVCSMFCMLHV